MHRLKLMLGSAVCEAPTCYRNFIRSNRHRIGRLLKENINRILREEPCRVVLRRERRGTGIMTFDMSTRRTAPSTLGYWYLDFSSKQDYMAFKMRWE